MTIALIGSHGTGKTTVYDELKKKYPDWIYFYEPVRYQMPAFGYKNAYSVVDLYGIGVFELLNINAWSMMDPQVNTLIPKEKTIVTDRSAVDNYAYYLSLKSTDHDAEVEDLVTRMAKHYAALVDLFVYFPVGVFPLVTDEMRIGDEDYQRHVDANIKVALDSLEVPKKKFIASRLPLLERG